MMMDPWHILGVTRDAAPAVIRRAYLALARTWHPDVCTHPEAQTRFQEIQAAYTLLRDPVALAAHVETEQAQSSVDALEHYRRQQALRRQVRKQRRDRNIGPGRWWR